CTVFPAHAHRPLVNIQQRSDAYLGSVNSPLWQWGCTAPRGNDCRLLVNEVQSFLQRLRWWLFSRLVDCFVSSSKDTYLFVVSRACDRWPLATSWQIFAPPSGLQ